MTTCTLGPIRRHSGIAGQYAYTVLVTYPNESTHETVFVGSTYGGGVTMIHPGLGSLQVFDAGRYGATLNPDWVRAFYAAH